MRKLVLKKEHLAELTSADLALVAGAAVPTIPVDRCVVVGEPSAQLAVCESLLRPCISYTCTR